MNLQTTYIRYGLPCDITENLALNGILAALLQRNEPKDREHAMSLLDESLAIFSKLGMRPLVERCCRGGRY